MTIQDWGAIGELIGGVAVIVTLVYLALQIRQNTRAIRLSTGHDVTEEFRGMFELIASHGDLAEIINKSAGEDITVSGAEKTRYWAFTGNFFRAFENAYIQRTEGALDASRWEGMKRMMIDYGHLPGFKEYWPNRKHWYSEDFQRFMDSEILQSSAKAGVPLPGSH